MKVPPGLTFQPSDESYKHGNYHVTSRTNPAPSSELASVYIANYRPVKTSDTNHTCKQKLPKETIEKEKENLKSKLRDEAEIFCRKLSKAIIKFASDTNKCSRGV